MSLISILLQLEEKLSIGHCDNKGNMFPHTDVKKENTYFLRIRVKALRMGL